ncbi:hypothetical protein PIB30_093621, partial [Stylosanthes scabra]|nr:hypothetical protein [Stylosanthes scabra]
VLNMLIEAKEEVDDVIEGLRKLMEVVGAEFMYLDSQWSGGTTYVCVELGIQEVKEGIFGINFPASGMLERRARKERRCYEISAHDDHMETPNYEIEQSARAYRNVLGKVRAESDPGYILDRSVTRPPRSVQNLLIFQNRNLL